MGAALQLKDIFKVKAYADQAKAKKIKEQSEKIKE